MKFTLKIIFFTLLLIQIACSNNKTNTNNAPKKAYFDYTGMDSTIKPSDNFFLYANGKWMKTAKIPDHQTGWGSFYTLYEENISKLRNILDETSKGIIQKGSLR